MSRKERKRLRKKKERNNSKRYSFSSEVKDEVKKRYDYRCAVTGKKTRLEVHHRYPKSLGRNNGIPLAMIRSIANALPLSPNAHADIHGKRRRREYWQKELEALKERYIGGIIFLLEYPDEMFNVVYDKVLGEQREVCD